MYLLDTNVISEIRKAPSGKANRNVIDWASNIPISNLYLSSISILELETGILLKERKDPEQASILHVWLKEHVLPSFENRILAFDTDVAIRCAALHVPDPRADRDSFIAATALVHGLTVVTRNIKDFIATNVNLLNPWG